VTLTAALAAAALAESAAAAVLPAALVESTREAALLVAAGKSVAEAAPATVAALTKGALQTMLWNKLNLAAACVLLAGALGVAGTVATQALGAGGTGLRPGGTPAANADEPKTAEPLADDKKDKGDAPAQEKKYKFEMREVPWAEVLAWYAEQSGLGFVGKARPAGNLTFLPPKGKTYTFTEITDILNEALLEQKYILIRRATTFTVLPADEKIDPTFLPRVRPDELNKRGRMELVTTVFPLVAVSANDIAPTVKKLLGTFGEVVVIDRANQLIVTDTAGNLSRVWQTLLDMEAKEAAKPDRPAK
jgi:hypothetical protein